MVLRRTPAMPPEALNCSVSSLAVFTAAASCGAAAPERKKTIAILISLGLLCASAGPHGRYPAHNTSAPPIQRMLFLIAALRLVPPAAVSSSLYLAAHEATRSLLMRSRPGSAETPTQVRAGLLGAKASSYTLL